LVNETAGTAARSGRRRGERSHRRGRAWVRTDSRHLDAR